ncbi:MAG: GNAT family N-acetyltransferase [SAR324 cluster bacterium]|nr:GNAT family N-acetyltransferase [SAR324 cluster bacterium]
MRFRDEKILIREACEFDFQKIVDINDAEVRHTSPMNIGQLHDLNRLSDYHKVAEIAGNITAFLLAMRENCSYRSDNYQWFSARYANFLYIDRIVVDAKFSGLKIGTMLYQNIFEYARSNRISLLTCEYNTIPPNEPSRQFHEKFGFKEVGEQWLAARTKKVSMQAAEIEHYDD